jgi:hypothetical protein
MILLDTNVLSELMRPQLDEGVVDWIDQHASASLWISAITRAEIMLGLSLLRPTASANSSRWILPSAF